MSVTANLLGVPESDHPEFRKALLTEVGAIGSSEGETTQHSPLEYLYGKFSEHISDRRANPRDDVLTGVASATFPDGSIPEVMDAVRLRPTCLPPGRRPPSACCPRR